MKQMIAFLWGAATASAAWCLVALRPNWKTDWWPALPITALIFSALGIIFIVGFYVSDHWNE